jgi:hypothetical protein
MDSKVSPAQADPHHDRDVVLLAPKDWSEAEDALCKLAHFASDRRHPAAGVDFSAGPRVTEPSRDASPLRADLNANLNDDPSPTARPTRARRASRGLARFLLTACVGAAATLAWQSYGGTAKQMMADAAPQLGLLLSPAMSPPLGRENGVGPPSPPAVQAFAPQAAFAPVGDVASTATEAAAATAPIVPASEVQQLETMAHDLAAVRQSLGELAAGQEQMARDIAKLQTAGQDIRRRISALPPAATATMHKPVPPPQAAPQLSAAPLSPAPTQPAPPSSGAALPPPAPEPPSRPPMPVR